MNVSGKLGSVFIRINKDRLKSALKLLPVPIAFVNMFPFVPSGRDVVEGPGKLDSQRVCHISFFLVILPGYHMGRPAHSVSKCVSFSLFVDKSTLIPQNDHTN